MKLKIFLKSIYKKIKTIYNNLKFKIGGIILNNNENDEKKEDVDLLKQMNMYQAELRQRAIEKYGRDIYAQKGIATKGLKRMKKINENIEKGLKVFLILMIIFLIALIAFALWIAWGPAYSNLNIQM